VTEIVLVRNGKRLSDAQIAAMMPALYGVVDGLSPIDKAAWRRFWGRVTRLEEGEVFTVDVKVRRNGRFHRKFFALLNVGFDAWEPTRKHKTYRGQPIQKNFEEFRSDVIILAGFYEQTFDLAGRMKLKAKSIAFSNMDEDEFEKVYSGVATVLLEKVLINYKGRDELDRVVNEIVNFL